ncbi:MAG TPA: valine--tRNA ligase, partial [Flavisolibacter sp.]|nr:valine--tRNA ligase [Flavisolibacter sp.]
VDYKDVQGKLYYIKYLIAGKGNTDYIVIATQRPETIMGDTAVCIHPGDKRYAHLKGQNVIVPLVNREVPVIEDDYVDPEFGTGALKITPAHDINDYNLGLKHNLPIIDTLNEDGTLSEAAEIFIGVDRFEARKKIIEKLKEENLLLKEEEYQTRLGFSQRTNAIVEPRISTQWFVKMKDLAGKALNAVLSGEIKIHPEERFLATYKYWLENVKDWCISRQLWWGQRIPAWYDADGKMVVAINEEEAKKEYQKQYPNAAMELTQDDDVLDTWFSSWLWPIEVFHGITEPGNADIEYYYPTSVLVTGQDIIFFWVARMIMAGMEYKNEKPFSDVYFTGMVRDKQGRKMSKSLGNSPDLLELIKRFGADAVRFGILISAPAGNDLLFDDSSCEQGRNFNNKIWNALKLIKSWESRTTEKIDSSENSFALTWFENKLNQVTIEVESLYKQFRLSEALKRIYSLIWDDFCSWYLEWAKPGFEQPIQKEVYEKSVQYFKKLVQVLHPFMPFISEEIYHVLDENVEQDLCITQFEKPALPDTSILQQGELLQQAISAIRDARIKNAIKPKDVIQLHIQTPEKQTFETIQSFLAKQVNANAVNYVDNAVGNSVSVVVGVHRFYIISEIELDITAQKIQLEKELDYQKGFLVSVEKKLSNDRFVNNAKPEVVEIERKKKFDAEQKIRTLEESIKELKN